MNVSRKLLTVIATLGLVACGGRSTAPAERSAKVVVQGDVRALTVADVTSVTITVDGAGIAGSPFPVNAGHFGPVSVNVAPGPHTFVATASAGGTTLSATGTVTATFGGSNSLTLYLFDPRPRQDLHPAPIVQSIGASPSALTVVGGASPVIPTSSLTSGVVSFDAGATLSYAWSDSCGGTFDDAAAANPQYTPPSYASQASRTCTLVLTTTATSSVGPVSDPVYSRASTTIDVSYVTPVLLNGELVVPAQFTEPSLSFGAPSVTTTCALTGTTGTYSAGNCAAELFGTGSHSIALQARFAPPPGAGSKVTVSAQGTADCGTALPAFSQAGTVAGTFDSASFTWTPGAVETDTACQLTLTVTFTDPTGSSSPSSVSASLPVAFLLHASRPVFNELPAVIPPSLPSLGFQATQTAEFGDVVSLAPGTGRYAAKATAAMVTWSTEAYSHPITLNLYGVAGGVLTPLASVTQTFAIPARPAASASCPGTQWLSSDGCRSGYAFPVTFDLTGLVLPDTFAYGIAYDTQTWGANPLGVDGPYTSLNVGLVGDGSTAASTLPSVGSDPDPDAVLWKTATAAWYTDGGAGGVNVFRADTNWTGSAPAVEFFAY